MRCSAVLVVVLAIFLGGRTSFSADTQPAGKQLKLNIVRADTNEPLAGVRGYYLVDGDRGTPFNVDDKGAFTVPLPASPRQVRLEITKDTFVRYSVTFGQGPQADPLPESYTAHVLPGIVVGGTVNDQDGKPVEGVKIQFEAFYEMPDHPGRSINGVGIAKTDAQGHWTFDGAPPKVTTLLLVSAQHPDYMLSSSHQNLRPVQFEQLKNKTLVSVIRRGVSVPGTVLDPNGKPIADARVGQDSLGLVNGTKSDAEGKFTLRGVEPGARNVMVDAPGYVVEATELTVAEGDHKPLEIHLQKGKTLQGRVVDTAGKPLAGAYVTFTPFEKFPRMQSHSTTDADGKFSWDGAPDRPVPATVFKQGYMRQPPVEIKPGEEAKLVIAEASNSGDPMGRPTLLTVRGTAVDDQTGAPIEKFKALVTAREKGSRGLMHIAQGQGDKGKYLVNLADAGESYIIRIDADGYLPAESPSLKDGGKLEFAARLKKAVPITAVLLQPDGKPAVGADAALRENMMIQVDDGRINGMWSNSPEVHRTQTNAEGHFELPARAGKVRIFAVHESGWGEWILDGQGTASEPLKLGVWSTLEGTIIEGGKPAVGRTIRLRPELTSAMLRDRATATARPFFQYETVTDARGHFAFDRLIDGTSELSVEQGREGPYQRVNEGLTMSVTVAPGEHRVLQLGGSGRPIIGKVVIPNDLKGKATMPSSGRITAIRPTFIPPTGFEAMTDAEKQKLRDAFKQSDVYQAYITHPTGYGVTVKPDGSFRAEDVPAGEYLLGISVYGNERSNDGMIPLIASARLPITVPPIPGGSSTEPLDVSGTEFEPTNPNPRKPVVMTAYKNVKAGDAAPDFEALNYDGKKVKLSDLRGKWVLLDFWATWCGPCIAEMPNVEKLYHKMESDPRVVIVGISLDDRQDEPTRFLKNRKLPWTQWYGGVAGPQPGFEAFGIHGIPSGWIISPEGKVIARDLEGDAVPAALEKALNTK